MFEPVSTTRSATGRLAAVLVVLLAAAQPATAQPGAASKQLARADQGGAETGQPIATAPAPPPQTALRPGADEAAYFARMDEAIAPVRDAVAAPDDVKGLRALAAALAANDPVRIQLALSDLRTPLAGKLATWLRLRSGNGVPGKFRDFLEANPTWPDRKLLVQRMEDALFSQGGDVQGILAIFAKSPPQTGPGHAALASAYLQLGDRAKAKHHAGLAWRDLRMPVLLETGFLERFGPLLTAADHKWRLDRLLIDDVRWSNDRKEREAIVRRQIALLPEGLERQKAEARLAVFLRAPHAARLMEAIPREADKDDWGLTYHRVQLLRRQNRDAEAKQLMLSAPIAARELVSPDDWWVERRANAYNALEAGNPKLAYDLVKDVGPLSVNPAKEQTFMAGWLALRHLGDARIAEQHFQAMAGHADGPLSRAKAAYWLGRAREAVRDAASARKHYETAARYIDTFHGQLARAKLAPDDRRIDLGLPARPTASEIERFRDSEVVQATVLAWKAGLDLSIVRAMLGHLARAVLKTEGEVAMAAHLAEAFKDTQTAVRIAKSAIARGQNLVVYGYPTHPFPAYTPLRTPPETAFLLAIARQESEFNTQIVSGAGARGLLQVMPITAKHVCRDYKIKCDIPRLLADRAYNTMMASAYIGDRMGEFQGSYVLALAGYNAGPGRARQWIRQFGDPRQAGVDPIDWIERIPFQETREYVAKVLSNIQVYRARLGDEANGLRVMEDLARARVASASDATGRPPSAPAATPGRTSGARDEAEADKSPSEPTR